MHKANKKTAFPKQEEIDWGAVPSRLCNEMRGEERRPIVKASGGGWRREEKRIYETKLSEVKAKEGGGI